MPNEVQPASWIQKTPGVIGGDACVRRRRLAVWMLVEAKRLGLTDAELRQRYDPPLTQADLDAAWDYFAAHRDEIEQALWINNAVMIEHEAASASANSWIQKAPDVSGGRACIRTTPIAVGSLLSARRLGLSEEQIRDAFYPPLSQADLDAAWRYHELHRDEIEADIRQYGGA